MHRAESLPQRSSCCRGWQSSQPNRTRSLIWRYSCSGVLVVRRKFLVWRSICMGTYCGMIARHVIQLFGAAGVTAWSFSAFAFPAAAVPAASAQPCPDTEVVFARGTGEPPGVGPTGQAFVDALRGRLGGKSMDVYPVN